MLQQEFLQPFLLILNPSSSVGNLLFSSSSPYIFIHKKVYMYGSS